LSHPQTLDLSSFDVLADDCPTVFVLKALEDKGWKSGRLKSSPHRKKEGVKTRLLYHVDPRSFRKPYLQCLLQLPGLFKERVEQVHVGQPLNYYHCLRRLPDKEFVLPNLRDADYKAMLAAKTARVPLSAPKLTDKAFGL
jgi:hypothetical protein